MILKDKILSILIFLPIFSSILILSIKNNRRRNTQIIALTSSICTIASCFFMYYSYDCSTPVMQFREHTRWIPSLGICYDLGLDGISLPFIMMTCFSSVIGILSATIFSGSALPECLAVILITQGLVTGILTALDSILFYIFWEGMLIPVYLSILNWGGINKSYASTKFFIYSFLSSLPMVMGFLYLGKKTNSFYIPNFYLTSLNFHEQTFLFIAFSICFMVKVPVFPLHTWFPEMLQESPLGGYAILYTLMIKLGIYGFLRFNFPITPNACCSYSKIMIFLSIISIVCIGILTISQENMKKFVAYSSISHIGMAVLGCFSIYSLGNMSDMQGAYTVLEGSMMQSLCHSFGTAGMFLVFSSLYKRFKCTEIKDISGIANKMPTLAFFYMLYSLSSIGLPGTSGFCGEFMIILTLLKSSPLSAIFAASTLVIGAIYTLRLYKRSFFGEFNAGLHKKISDISITEKIMFFLLTVPLITLGLFPQPLLNIMHSSIANLVTVAMCSKSTAGTLL